MNAQNKDGEIAQSYTSGMSLRDLRDWFAGQALVGIMTRGPLSPSDAAWAAYAVADAMLEARK